MADWQGNIEFFTFFICLIIFFKIIHLFIFYFFFNVCINI